MELAGVPRQVNARVAKQVNASGLEPDSLTGLRVRVPPRAFSITFDTILQLDARAMNQSIDLLVTLQRLLDEQTGRISIPPHILERIARYAFKYGNGGWEDRLLSVFSRTLGRRLDGNL